MRKETTRVSKETHTIIEILEGKWFDAFRENRELKPKGCQQISVKQMQNGYGTNFSNAWELLTCNTPPLYYQETTAYSSAIFPRPKRIRITRKT
jgi:hypothetical protein